MSLEKYIGEGGLLVGTALSKEHVPYPKKGPADLARRSYSYRSKVDLLLRPKYTFVSCFIVLKSDVVGEIDLTTLLP